MPALVSAGRTRLRFSSATKTCATSCAASVAMTSCLEARTMTCSLAARAPTTSMGRRLRCVPICAGGHRHRSARRFRDPGAGLPRVVLRQPRHFGLDRARSARRQVQPCSPGKATFHGVLRQCRRGRCGISFAEISFVEPLPAIAPLLRRDDAGGSRGAHAGRRAVARRCRVRGGPRAVGSSAHGERGCGGAAGHPDQPWHNGAMLSVRWATEKPGSIFSVPGVNYGFDGTNLLTEGSR